MVRRFPESLCTALFTCALVIAFMVGNGFAETAVADKIAAKFSNKGGYADLVSKAEKTGSVRVLARVRSAFTPETGLSKADADTQRTVIGRAQRSLMSELENAGIKTAGSYSYRYIPYVFLNVDKTGLAALAASSQVVSIEEDELAKPTATPGWDILQVGATALHMAGHTGKGAVVAVLDTGVDKNHPYLAGAVVSEACYSTTYPDVGAISLCPGGAAESTEVDSALPYGTGVCPAGECDHGTHVAGTVAGRNNVEGSPGPGMAPDAGIIAIQVFTLFDNEGYCGDTPCTLSYTSDQVKGLERVYELKTTYRIAALNMSLGGGQYLTAEGCDESNTSRKLMIDTLRGVGIASVISSGNDGYCGSMGAPGCISTAVSVGATDSDDKVAWYSNSTSWLSILAPGSNITSSVPGGTYEAWNGTSMAAPHVAGAWALIVADRPTATVNEVLNGLVATGVTVTDTGKCDSVTKKRINVYDAYNRLIPPPVMRVSPGTGINFGNAREGVASAARTVTIRNAGPAHCAPLNVSSISAGPADEFILTDASCPPIPRGGSCTFNVHLTANGYGTRRANLTILSDAPKQPSVTLGLTGTVKPPIISLWSLNTNFGTVDIGSEAVTTLTIKNTGYSDLVLNNIIADGDTSFSFYNIQCPKILMRSQSCKIIAYFAPTTSGQASCTLTIFSNDPNERRAALTATLRGRGR